MPPKAGKDKAELLNAADQHVLEESKRLQDIAYGGMLSKTRRMCTNEILPSKVLAKADGKDITKRSSVRKGRYLLNINAKIAAAAAGRMGALAQLDSKNPVLYIDFPEGRMKFFGTLMFPSNKYMVLKFTNKDVICEDILESMVVFSEAWWIGKKEDNPEEFRLPLPQSVIEAGKKAQDASKATLPTDPGEAKGTQTTANGRSNAGRAAGKRALADSDESDGSDGASSQDDDDIPLTGRRMSQRSTKRPKYNVDADSGEEEEGDADGSDDDEGDFQRLKAPPKARTPAKAPEQNIADAEPGPSQPGPSRGQQPAADVAPSGDPARKGPAAKAKPAWALKQATLSFGRAAQVSNPGKATRQKEASGDDSNIEGDPSSSEVFPRQQTITLSCQSCYLRVSTSFEGGDISLNPSFVKAAIQQSLRQVFGIIGGAVSFEVLEVKEDKNYSFLKVDKRDYEKLRAAITLLTNFDGKLCHFQVEAASPFLASLATDSRAFASQLPFPP
ncbi:hypothetical protein WJX75_007295 [Coccomyxa subellipsoidea]|uniref:Ribonucleases P/MRP subunit Pop8-like domain-containing protein n=1 Tax=Coccomyxa subellipsoidea TaxID=248742 RepID=A0ABR2YLF7_9CHLO